MIGEPFPPVRIGVVGVGTFGRLYARTLAGLSEAQLVAIVDPEEAARKEIRRLLPGARVWSDLETALRESGAEAWVIATRTPLHVSLAETILAAGGHVLVEKPLAESLEAARRLEPLISASSRHLMAGHLLLFAPDFRQLAREALARRPLIYFHLSRHRPVSTLDAYPEETPLSLLMVHDLYLAYVLMGGEEPVRISARMRRRADGRCDLVRAEMEWAKGAVGAFTASFLTPPGMGPDGFDRIEAFGPDWSAEISLNPQPLKVYTDRLDWPRALAIDAGPEAPTGWLAEELRCFCRVVRGRAEIPLGARYADALCIQSWLERLKQSAEGEEYAG